MTLAAPVIGEPDEVLAAGETFQGMRASILGAMDSLQTVQSGSTAWKGKFADQLHKFLPEFSAGIDATHSFFDDMAHALENYGREMDAARKMWKSVVAQGLDGDPHKVQAVTTLVAAAEAELRTKLQSIPHPRHARTRVTRRGFRHHVDGQPQPLKQSGLSAGYVPQAGILWGPGGPSVADITEGELSDCYMLAAIAAIVRIDPGAIERMIRDNHDGTYTVTIAGTSITVDATTPEFANQHGLLYNTAVPTDHGAYHALWVPVLEKAFAEGLGGYGAIGNGGDPRGVLSALLPNSHVLAVGPVAQHPASVARFEQLLTTGTTHNYPMTAATLLPNQVTPAVQTLAQHYNLLTDHVYYVTGYNASAGTVSLGNPWGVAPSFTPAPIPINDFHTLCAELAIAQPAG